jgi:anaphase-promoting complex subunit 1
MFHNGVAAGLRIARASHSKLSTTWIAYHRPANNHELSHDHAGFLMALGLLGHLADLSTMTLYDYLAQVCWGQW